MRLELGPILRALSRRKSAFLLIVLELASGFTIICSLMLAGSWYRKVGEVHSGDHDDELVEVTVQRPVTTSDAEAASAEAARWQAEALAMLTATPHVIAAATVSTSLLDERVPLPSVLRVSGPAPAANTRRPAGPAPGWAVLASPTLPEVLDLRLEGGGRFADLPLEKRAGTVVITRCLRDQLFAAGEDVTRFKLSSGEIDEAPIIGVVQDLYLRRPFMSDTQCQPFYFVAPRDEREGRFLLRVDDAAARDAVVAALTRVLGARYRDATTAVRPYTLENARHYRITHGILLMLFVVAFNIAVVALIGPLAVSSFLVAERTRQIGVRRALGATRVDIIRYFLVENALACALGTAIGVAITVVFVATMHGAFYSVGLGPRHLALAALLLWINGAIAALIPALRAARIAPSVATRAR